MRYKHRTDLRKELRAGHSGHTPRAKPAAQQASSTVMQNAAERARWMVSPQRYTHLHVNMTLFGRRVFEDITKALK